MLKPVDKSLSEKLASMVAFRLAFGGLTLGGLATFETLFSEDRLPGEVMQALAPLGGLALLVFASALVVLVAIRQGFVHPGLAWLQAATDLFIAAALTLRAGGAESPFSMFFGVAVLSAAVALGRRAVLLVAGAASLILVLIALMNSGLTQRSALAVFQQVAAFFAVGWLASSFHIASAYADSRRLNAERRLRASEHFYERVLSSMGSGVLITDPSGVIAFANPAALEICDLKEAAGLRLQTVAPALAAATASDRGECALLTGSGQRIIGYSRVLLKDAGKQLATTLVFRDLTHIREMEAQAAQSEKLAAIGRMAAGIAHELRNPLGALSGALELVRGSELLPQDKELLALAARETDRLGKLIEDFLDFARPHPLERTECDLKMLLGETAALVRRDPNLGGRDLVISGEAQRLMVDPNQMRQVFWNLIKNACEASPVGSKIEVSIEDGETAAWVRIEDSGPGMAAQDSARLFEPFFTTKPKGTGLGLAVVRQIVETHGGQVLARPGKERGMVFSVRLPRG